MLNSKLKVTFIEIIFKVMKELKRSKIFVGDHHYDILFDKYT